MFSLRSESQPQRARIHGVNKRASSSRASLLSSVTSYSKKSTASSSTITQESYSKSERQSKRRSNRSAKLRRTTNTPASMQAERRPRRSREHSASDIDVFSYLVDDDIVDPSETSTSWEAEQRRVSKRASVQDDPDELETKSVRSRLSDSGVSMNDSGYDSTSPTAYMKPRLGSLPENVFVESYDQLQRNQYEAPPQMPRAFTQGQIQISYPYQYENGPTPPNSEHCLRIDDPRRHPHCTTQPPLSGYSLLASHLSHSQTTPHLHPIYRRFTTLHHRLLLQLQDEISEMETELRRLDDIDTYHRQGEDLPASRRTERASRRLILLSDIHMKLEHYHGAVLRMARVNAVTSDAREEDVEVYRKYLAVERPLQEMEMRFLDDGEDLLALDAGATPMSGSETLLAPPTPVGTSHLSPPYNFTLLSSLAGVWLLACMPSLLSRWAFLLLLACLTIATQPSNLPSPSSASSGFDASWPSLKARLIEAYTRAKDIAPPLLFWMAVMMVC